MEQIFVGLFPDTPKDIVSGNCKFSAQMCYTWIIITIIIIIIIIIITKKIFQNFRGVFALKRADEFLKHVTTDVLKP